MRVVLLLLVFTFSSSVFAQESGEVRLVDTAGLVTVDTIGPLNTKKERKPGNALKWALIPGGGQIYNRSWWKVPLVYGGLLGAVGVADFNQTNFSRAVTALRAKCFGNDIPDDCEESPHEFTGTPLDDVSALRNVRDNFDKQKQTAYIFIFVAYLLQGVEAYTDAHLKSFDVEDDLSWIKIGPTQQPGESIGYGLTVPLGSGRKNRLQHAKIRQASIK